MLDSREMSLAVGEGRETTEINQRIERELVQLVAVGVSWLEAYVREARAASARALRPRRPRLHGAGARGGLRGRVGDARGARHRRGACMTDIEALKRGGAAVQRIRVSQIVVWESGESFTIDFDPERDVLAVSKDEVVVYQQEITEEQGGGLAQIRVDLAKCPVVSFVNLRDMEEV